MKEIIINGIFYRNRLTGIERFAHEITQRLDKLTEYGEIKLILPSNAPENIPEYKNIIVKRQIKTPNFVPANLKMDFYMFFHKSFCIDYANRTPLIGNNLVFLHDIYCRVFKKDFKGLKDKILMKRTCMMYKRVCKKAKVICTVSEYSKRQIMQYYNVPEEKIRVIYNGWEHIKNTVEDEKIFERLPEIKGRDFYFTLGSLSIRKNLKWILDHAELYPNELFVISGTMLKTVIPPELEKLKTLKNVIVAGYLSDAEVKALMCKCKAFVFPSYFEGFGIPPLEALYCGCPIIISNASCLPEIYGKTAHYINPENPAVNLDALLAEPVESPEPLFEKYSYDMAAKQLYKILKELRLNGKE